MGRNRSLELPPREPVHLASVTLTPEGGAEIALQNWNPFTRVHVVANRFVPTRNLFSSLGGFTRWGLGSKTPDFLPNLYSAGREIGDEYRYILDRRYAPKHPGNRLPRPGLLLNPWDKRSTDSEALPVSGGAAPLASMGNQPGLAMMADMLGRS